MFITHRPCAVKIGAIRRYSVTAGGAIDARRRLPYSDGRNSTIAYYGSRPTCTLIGQSVRYVRSGMGGTRDKINCEQHQRPKRECASLRESVGARATGCDTRVYSWHRSGTMST
jgi:hypothetical protein